MRHGSNGLTLVPVRAVVGAVPSRRSWRAWVVFPAGLGVLAAGLALLLTGAYLTPASARGSCPRRMSTVAYASGHELLSRAEPAVGGTILVHLCTDDAIGPVTNWVVRVETGVPGTPSVAVQRVAAGEALAAIPLEPGRRYPISVMVVAGTARPLTFVTQIAAY